MHRYPKSPKMTPWIRTIRKVAPLAAMLVASLSVPVFAQGRCGGGGGGGGMRGGGGGMAMMGGGGGGMRMMGGGGMRMGGGMGMMGGGMCGQGSMTGTTTGTTTDTSAALLAMQQQLLAAQSQDVTSYRARQMQAAQWQAQKNEERQQEYARRRQLRAARVAEAKLAAEVKAAARAEETTTAEPTDAQREWKAKADLELAQRLLATDHTAGAKRFLERVIQECPEMPVSEQAREMLSQL